MSKYLFQIWNEKNKKNMYNKSFGTTDAKQLSGTYNGTCPYKAANWKPNAWDYFRNKKKTIQMNGLVKPYSSFQPLNPSVLPSKKSKYVSYVFFDF